MRLLSLAEEAHQVTLVQGISVWPVCMTLPVIKGCFGAYRQEAFFKELTEHSLHIDVLSYSV